MLDGRAIGTALGAPVARVDAIAGGDINGAHRVALADGRVVFVKSHAFAPAGMFAAEADGLAWLRVDGGPRVPAVLAAAEGWLALEWLELGGRPSMAAFGRALAVLHRAGAGSFGFARATYLATLPQDHAAAPDWGMFYVERRLRPLCRRAGLRVDRELDVLRARPDLFGDPEPPARLHGDLWWGNVASCAGAPVIFDPAVYGGHREVDLAMLALFGELPEALISAYSNVFQLSPGWRDRLPLHQLYPLAAHACLFGGSYGPRVREILGRLVGQA
jgi:fructosamine-3-kinase